MTTYNEPKIGGGATISYGSDCHPATIINISPSGRRITIQMDKATRIDNNGMSEIQEYEYSADPNGTVLIASLRRDGRWRVINSQTPVSINGRRKFHDFSF